MSSHGLLGGFSMDLNAAHADSAAVGKDLQFVFLADRAGNQRSRDHRTEAFHGEDAIDRQAGDRAGVSRCGLRCDLHQGVLQLGKSGSCERTDRDNGAGVSKERPAQEILHLRPHYIERFRIDGIGLSEHRDATAH